MRCAAVPGRDADASKLDAVLHPEFREVTLHLMDGVWDFAAVDRQKLIGLMAKITKGSCGIETFQLYRIDNAWKIVNFADTHSDHRS